MPVEAARALLDAGRQAIRVSAFRGALNLFDHGLELLRTEDTEGSWEGRPGEPELTDRGQLGRQLMIARLVPQRTLSGAGAEELRGAVAQVIEAGARDAQDRTKLATLVSEAEQLIARGRFADSLAAAQQALDLATQCGDDAFEAMAHFWFGFVYHLLGEAEKAEAYLEWIFAPLAGPVARAPRARRL